MLKLVWISLISFLLFSGCKKDTISKPECPSEKPIEHTLSFVFVNRIGFRNDSTKHGQNDTVFQGGCFDAKYYDKNANVTYLNSTCYNRNFPSNSFPLSDSIILVAHKLSVGSRYTFQIELGWKNASFATVKVLKYATKNYLLGDTIKSDRDTVVKFIWPNDTLSGNYIKTYSWP